MPTLREIQLQFGDYLTSGDDSITALVDDSDVEERRTRLDIYRNAYRLRLKECIDKDHDILGRYLGDGLFDQLCREFIDAYPSVYPSLRHFCDPLPDFLKSAPPFSGIPILAEIASFERCLMFTFDAANGSVATLSDLHQIPATEWPSLAITFHPSTNCLVANWNSVETWQALKADQQPPAATQQDHQIHWLIWRGTDRLTQYRALEYDASILYACLRQGDSLATCCERLISIVREDAIGPRVAEHLENWTTAGIVSDIHTV